MGDLGVRVLILVAVLAVATAGGLVWRARNGRVRPEDRMHAWAELGFDPGDAAVTLVQFSSAFCAPCRATRQILQTVSSELPAVAHVEVDAESHLDLVRALDVHSTPTTLLVDRTGTITGRAVGRPRREDVLAAVGTYL